MPALCNVDKEPIDCSIDSFNNGSSVEPNLAGKSETQLTRRFPRLVPLRVSQNLPPFARVTKDSDPQAQEGHSRDASSRPHRPMSEVPDGTHQTKLLESRREKIADGYSATAQHLSGGFKGLALCCQFRWLFSYH